jgi:hypothetical protein
MNSRRHWVVYNCLQTFCTLLNSRGANEQTIMIYSRGRVDHGLIMSSQICDNPLASVKLCSFLIGEMGQGLAFDS